MHMTCSQCKFEFCWLCSGDWKEHGERTGGHYACNRFETAKRKGESDDPNLSYLRTACPLPSLLPCPLHHPPPLPLFTLSGEYDEETKRKENAKFALERYTHYFEVRERVVILLIELYN